MTIALRVRRFFGSSGLLDWLFCVAVGHDDVFQRDQDRLGVRCLRCGRLSVGIEI